MGNQREGGMGQNEDAGLRWRGVGGGAYHLVAGVLVTGSVRVCAMEDLRTRERAR